MHFLSIDVETANPYMGSICQIGIARFVDGKIVEEWSTLIDPESYFDEFNSSIHGISPAMVAGKPKLPQVSEKVRLLLESGLTVCHTHFDRIAIAQAFGGYDLKPISTTWLDSARVARRTWDDVSRSGSGLSNLRCKIGYEFKHHDALEDAKAAGQVLLAAIRAKTANDIGLGENRVTHHRAKRRLVNEGIQIRLVWQLKGSVMLEQPCHRHFQRATGVEARRTGIGVRCFLGPHGRL